MTDKELAELREQAIKIHNDDEGSQGNVYHTETLAALILAKATEKQVEAITRLAKVIKEHK